MTEAEPYQLLAEQLAAEQLNNKLLRDALQEYIDEHEECQDADDWMAMMCSMEAHHAANEALSLPASTEALDAYVAEKVKAIEAERDYHMSNAKHVYEQCSKITKQRDLAVEALEKVGELMLCGKKDQLPGRCDSASKLVINALSTIKGSEK